jgi:signal transduction histidine kinase
MNEAQSLRVILVEDSQTDAELVLRQLTQDGFACDARRVVTQAELEQALRGNPWDVVISDYTLPQFNGIEALRVVRTYNTEVPFIFFSGTLGETLAVQALKSGAQDFLTKQQLGLLGTAVSSGLKDASERRALRQAEERERLYREEAVRTEKLTALGRLVSGVAHEITDSSNSIMLNLSLLSQSWESIVPILDQFYQDTGNFQIAGLDYTRMRANIPLLFEGVSENARRIHQIVSTFKHLTRPDKEELTDDIDINQVVRSAILLSESCIQRATRRFTVQLADAAPKIRGSPERLVHAVVNLLQNACDSLRSRVSAITVITSVRAMEHLVIVEVRDEGRGMPRDVLEHATDAFFTTKADHGVMGLGLTVASRIVQEHDGQIEVQSVPGKGTTVRVTLPALP